VYALNNFDNYCMEKFGKADIIEDLKKYRVDSSDTIFDVLQHWINWTQIKPNSIGGYFGKIKFYLHYMGIKLNPMDIKQSLIFPKIEEEERYPMQFEEVIKIFDNLNYKAKKAPSLPVIKHDEDW